MTLQSLYDLVLKTCTTLEDLSEQRIKMEEMGREDAKFNALMDCLDFGEFEKLKEIYKNGIEPSDPAGFEGGFCDNH